ncbi:MAG TPA: twin-arginine translocation signal domain-containing protein, partial [Myxococcales bacterium]|nr:twin-arginine translocation signal domain-containing protein [Myxococcales bacterium]
MKMSISRRSLLKKSVVAGVAGAVGVPLAASSKRGRKKRDRKKTSVSDTGQGLFFGYEPFTQELVLPRVLSRLDGGERLDPKPGSYPRAGGAGRGPVAPTGSFEDVSHGIAPEFGYFPDMNQFNTGFSDGDTHEAEFGLVVEETLHRFVPDGP